MMFKNHSVSQRLVALVLLGIAVLVIVPAMYASNKGLGDWRDHYPDSNSDAAGCQMCHGVSLGQLNSYGRDICLQFAALDYVPKDWGDVLSAVEPLNSDQDPNDSDNGLEIDNHTQPGWTTGPNPLYIADFTEGCAEVAADSTVPDNVPLPYDIAITGDPIANPGGPYEALTGETITFDGDGSTDDGEIVQYDWTFGDGTSAADAGPYPQHAYDEEGLYNVVLTVTDNEGNISAGATTATISPLNLLDLDIDALKVSRTGRVGKSIGEITLIVENNGAVLGQAIATVVGEQNGKEVFRLRLNVYDDIGKGTTSHSFGTFVPSAPGEITWTADIADEDPDNDLVTATTLIK